MTLLVSRLVSYDSTSLEGFNCMPIPHKLTIVFVVVVMAKIKNHVQRYNERIA